MRAVASSRLVSRTAAIQMTGKSSAPSQHAIYGLSRLGGSPSLDFANTMAPRFGGSPRDLLVDAETVVHWGVSAGLVQKTQLTSMLAKVEHSSHARALLTEARILREAIFAVFVANAERKPIPPQAAEALERGFIRSLERMRLVRSDRTYRWASCAERPEAILDLVAHDAVDLLRSPRCHRVKLCASEEDCGWLFLDTTKSGTRRWCSMEICGNRAKVQRYRRRHRAGDG